MTPQIEAFAKELESGCPDDYHIVFDCLYRQYKEHPEKIALIFEGEQTSRYTFAQVYREVVKISQKLGSLKLSSGSRVLLRLPNEPDYAFAFFGVLLSGLIAVPLSPQLSDAEVTFIAKDCGASLLCVDSSSAIPADFPDECQTLLLDKKTGLSLEDTSEEPLIWPENSLLHGKDTPAYLVYTSGTTGFPKGVLHAHRSVWARRRMHVGWHQIQKEDIVLHAGQLNWTYTMGVGVFDSWVAGATCVLYGGPKDIRVWPSLFQKHQISIFAAVPTIYRQILKYCEEISVQGTQLLSSLRYGLTAGEALRPNLLARWKKATGLELFEALGMSECSTYISHCPGERIVPGSSGKIQPGRKVSILPVEGGENPVDVGESGLLAIHRDEPGLMLRYWHPEVKDTQTFRGDWFLGGDVVHLDEEGYIWFHGRNNDMMNAMGYRVSPLEVEKVLSAHPDILDVGVIEWQVREDVSVIAAFVVFRDGCDFVSEELHRWCEEQLAAYKCPRAWYQVASLPRTGSGKLKRQALGSMVS